MPAGAIIERDIQTVARSGIEQSWPDRVFAYDVRVAQRTGGDALDDTHPARTVVLGDPQFRLRRVHLVRVDRNVGLAGDVARRFDATHGAERRQAVHVLADVIPASAVVPADVDQTVVRSGPDHALFQRRLGDREQYRGVRGTGVIRRETARLALQFGVVGGQVGADDLPGAAAVVGAMNVLAAGVDDVVVVRRDREREGPLESIANVACRPAFGVVGPDADVLRVSSAQVIAFEDAVVAARPDDVAVGGVRNGPSRLAAADGMPGGRGDAAARQGVARAAERRTVLAVAIQEVGHLVVGPHVVHLGDGERRCPPVLAAIGRNRYAAIVTNDHAIRNQRIDPHVVVVAAGADAIH